MNKKIILLAMLFTASAIFISCDRNNDTEPEIVLTSPEAVRNQTVYADQTTTSAVSFNATGTWTATVSAPPTTTAHTETVRSTVDWVTLSANSGVAGDHTLTIMLGTNFEGVNRTAIITIRSGDTEIVITITQRGTDAGGKIPQCPEKNPYAGLTQSQIIEMLNNSLFAPVVKFEIISLSDYYTRYRVEVNRNQRKMLFISLRQNGGTWGFDYIEDLTWYYYEYCYLGSFAMRSSLPNDFWDKNEEYWLNEFGFRDVRFWLAFDIFYWTVSGRTFTGTASYDGEVITTTVKLNESNQIISIVVDGGNFEIQSINIAHDNVNPTFPAGFNRGNFREGGIPEPDPVSFIQATNVIGNTAGVTAVIAGAGVIMHDGGHMEFQEVLAEVPFLNNGFTLQLSSSPTILYPLIDEFPFPTNLTDVTISDNAARWSFAEFWGFNSAGNRIGRFEYSNDEGWDNPTLLNSAVWFYVDKDVTITGEFSETRYWDSGGSHTDIVTYNLNLRRGWNIVYFRNTRTRVGYVHTYTHTLTSQRPADANLSWRFWQSFDSYTRSATSVERQSLFLRR